MAAALASTNAYSLGNDHHGTTSSSSLLPGHVRPVHCVLGARQLDRAGQSRAAGRPYVPGAPNASVERKDARIASQHTVHNAPTDPGHTPLTTGSKGAHSDRVKT